ncbi:CotS family spore coat protein [Vallitalea pronyensis]|nr:CotS family spore coat protein [Vallitalea pronyensis]
MKVTNSLSELMDIASHVLSKYNIVPQDIKVIQNDGLKSLWRFNYNGETLCLKRLRHTLEKATFSVNAQRHIYTKGGKVPKIHLNTSGEAITIHNEQLFVLYEWIHGRDLNFTKSADFVRGIEGLAAFHAMSTGYQAPEGAKISTKLGRWVDQYTSMRNRMEKWKGIASENPSHSGYKTYLQYIDGIIALCNQAIEQLEKSSYGQLTNKALHESTMCHQDYGSGNAIGTTDDVYIIDLDGVTYDLPARDLRKIIGKRAEKRGKWELDDIHNILAMYNKNNLLSSEDKEVLKIDMLFPHWFFGTIKNIFAKNKSVNPGKIAKIAKLEQQKIAILNQWH